MKKLIMYLLIGTLLVPTITLAEEQTKTVSLGLKEACESENITFNHENYKESNEKANIYLFRGSGCSHCYEFLTYLEAMAEEFGKYFNLISYEVWQNEENNKLMKETASKMGETVTGVPYIVIGDKSWNGYGEDLNEEIYNAIMEEYKNGNKNDVFNRKKSPLTDVLVVTGAVVLVGLFIYARSKTKEGQQES